MRGRGQAATHPKGVDFLWVFPWQAGRRRTHFLAIPNHFGGLTTPRPRKSEAELKALGTYRKDRHTNRDGPPAVGEPVPLQELAGDARQLWDFVLEASPVELGAGDGAVLEAACRTWGLYVACQERLAEDPTDKDARIASHQYLTLVDKILAKYGMTPADRVKLPYEPPLTEQDMKTLQYLNRR